MSNKKGMADDVYEFNDNSKSRKSSRKQSRTASLISKSSKSNTNENSTKVDVKSSSKVVKGSKCEPFKEVVKQMTWINDITPQNKSDVENVLSILKKHLKDECKCVAEAAIHLLIANAHYELFLLKLRNFENNISVEEQLLDSEESVPSKSPPTRKLINDIPVNRGSKFDSNNMKSMVNISNMTELVSDLKQAVVEFEKGLNNGIRHMTLTDDVITKLKVYSNLSAIFQLFTLYKLYDFQLKTALLLERFCRYYSPKYSEIRLTAAYYLTKSYIDMGAVSKALVCHSNSVNPSSKPIPDSYGASLMFIAKCELDLLSGNEDKAAKAGAHLKTFLESEYLKRLTINRYYIKGLALMTASKFSGKYFNYSNCFQEFIEPIQMSICILKRWHDFLSTPLKKNSENIIICGDADPMWYRFAVLNFSLNALQLSANFYVNIGIPVDAVYYYTQILKLSRRHCAVIWVSRILIIGSQLDVICDHKYSAETKLSNAKSSLDECSYERAFSSVFESNSSVSTISPVTKAVLEDHYKRFRPQTKSEYDIEPMPPIGVNYEDFNDDECEHQNFNLWDIKKKLLGSVSQSEPEDVFTGRGRASSASTGHSSITDNVNLIEVFLLKTEIEINYLLVNERDSAYILRQLNDIYLNSIESFTSNIYRLKINELLKYDPNKSYKITEKELEKYGLSKPLKYKIYENIAKINLENKDYKDVLKVVKLTNNCSVFTYEERMSKSKLLLFEALSRFEILKQNNHFSDKVWLEYSSKSVESISGLPSIVIRTPSPPSNKSKNCVPNAPKNKREYKTEEIHDYMIALKNAVYKESKANKTNECVSSSCKRKPLQTKSNKLNFENDNISRSLPIETSNLDNNELLNKIIDVLPVEISAQSHRITRSLSKTYISTKVTVTAESSKQRLSEKSTKGSINQKRSIISSYNKSEKSDESVSFNDDLEDLDEVFQDLNIKEDIDLLESDSNGKMKDFDYCLKLLNESLSCMSSHPNAIIYCSVHRALSEIYSMSVDINKELIAYHFAESSNAISFRYRNLIIAEKKKKMNKAFKYDVNKLVFEELKSEKTINTLMNNVPNDWRIIQLAIVENGSKIPDLLICRYQNQKNPIYLKIKADPEKIIKYFMENFNDIIERSNGSIVNKDRETFWRLRFALDDELMILLKSVEETWFGPFRGILFGQLKNERYQQMCDELQSEIINYAHQSSLVCCDRDLLYVIIESLPALKYCEFKSAMRLLFNKPKDNLISKCYAKFEELFSSIYPIETKDLIFSTYQKSAVGFILDKSLESFPFESLPSLLTYTQPIFRTPSVRILSVMVDAFKDDIYINGVNQKSVFYVLNPADNLAKTEDCFKDKFKSIEAWDGVIGKSPAPEQLKTAFESKDVYIFFGHGAGASYYRTIPEGLDGCVINSASLIIGCSSGKLFSDGKQLESYGIPYRFMINGSPSYVGILWDVTDKDIDKFSDQLLTNWFPIWNCNSQSNQPLMPITSAVSTSRSVCKLKYLIGSSPVVYGLPLFTKSNSS